MNDTKLGNHMTQDKERIGNTDARRFDMLPQTDGPLYDLTDEVIGASERVKNYEDRIRAASEIRLVIGCDDGRVGVPSDLLDGVLYVYIPKIGGGLPSEVLLRDIIKQICDIRGVDVGDSSKLGFLRIIATQHAAPKEIEWAAEHNAEDVCDCITCGLRNVFSGAEADLQALGVILRRVSINKNGYYHPIQFSRIAEVAPEAAQQIEAIYIATKGKIPRRLIKIAAEQNFSSNIRANGDRVLETIQSWNVLPVEQVSGGIFNHKVKKISIDDFQGIEQESIDLGFEPSAKDEQDPDGFNVSFGPESVLGPDGVVLPKAVGEDRIDNDFTANALESEDDLLDALSEVAYAAGHHKEVKEASHDHDNGDKAHDFAHVKYCSILCDDETYVAKARAVLHSEEFKTDLAPIYSAVRFIQLVNIKAGSVEIVDVNKL